MNKRVRKMDIHDGVVGVIWTGLRRCGKSCRLRWTNYLRPDLKHGHFTDREEQLIVNLHAALGSR